MDADALLHSELHQRGVSAVAELSDDELVELGLKYAIWLPQQTYIDTPWLAPFAVRRIRVRTDVNAPGPPRDLWGFPDPSGYFTDDNSLIKGVIRGRRVDGICIPYGQEKLSTGLVCCHVWPNTSDPLLFSFVPNLVWLPRSLAGFSDAHFLSRDPHPLHFALKAASRLRFRGARTHAALRTDAAWARLDESPALVETLLAAGGELTNAEGVSGLARRRIERVTYFLDEIIADRRPPRRVSRRYHAGIGSRIDSSFPAIQSFVPRRDLEQLRAELRDSVQTSKNSK